MWSLSIEGQFYILWPIIIALILYKKETYQRLTQFILFTMSLSAILMIAFYNPETLNRIYYGTDTRIFSILLGAYLAIFLKDYEEKIANVKDSQKLLVFILSSVFILFSFIFIKDNSAFVYQGGMLIFSIISTILLACVLTHDKSNLLLSNPIFKWIGTRSYEIYLWQFPVMITYEKLIKWDGSNSWWHLFVQFSIILLLSEFTYQAVFFIRNHVTFSKDWLTEILEDWQGKAILLSSLFLLGLFTYSFYVAPSGRSEASVSLEKKLEENKKIITSEIKDDKEEIKETKNSTESTKKESEEVTKDKELVTLSNQEITFLKDINLTAVGDSLLLSAAPEIQTIFPTSVIDAEVGRQFVDSEPIFEKMTKDNKIGDAILVVLGTNGSFTSKDVSEIMTYSEGKEIFFVNTMVQRPWQKAVNDELIKTEETYKNAHVIDWKDYSAETLDWFDVDDVHLTPVGAENFANLIGKEIYNELKK